MLDIVVNTFSCYKFHEKDVIIVLILQVRDRGTKKDKDFSDILWEN